MSIINVHSGGQRAKSTLQWLCPHFTFLLIHSFSSSASSGSSSLFSQYIDRNKDAPSAQSATCCDHGSQQNGDCAESIPHIKIVKEIGGHDVSL